MTVVRSEKDGVDPAGGPGAHAALSPLAAEFVEYALGHPGGPGVPAAGVAEGGALPRWLRRFPYEVQRWPTLVGGEKLATLRRATERLAALVKSVPDRVFGRDPGAISRFYGLGDPRLAALLLEPPTGLPEAVCRLDFVDGPEGFRCLEVNASAYLGGWQLRYWEGLLRSDPVVAGFLAHCGVAAVHLDPLKRMLAHLAGHALARRGGTAGGLHLAVLVDREEFPVEDLPRGELGALYEEVLEELGPGLRGDLLFCLSQEELEESAGAISAGGRRVDALLEYTRHPTSQAVYRAFKSGGLSLFNGPGRFMLGDKRNLALLSEAADDGRLGMEDEALVREHVPWTRVLSRTPVCHAGRSAPLLEILLEDRGRWVLKPARGSRGEGVSVGRLLTAAGWRSAVAAALEEEGRWLAQEHVPSWPLLYHDPAAGPRPHDVVWGLFCFGGSYGGGFLRMMPSGAGGGVINAHRGASEGLLFEV